MKYMKPSGMNLTARIAPVLLTLLMTGLTACSKSPGTRGIFPLQASFYEDRSAKLEIRDVIRPDFQTRFQSLEKNAPIFGLTRSLYWIRLESGRLPRNSQRMHLYIDHPSFERLDIYYTDGKKTIHHAGPPKTNRGLGYRKLVFTLPDRFDSGPIYLRIFNPRQSFEFRAEYANTEGIIKLTNMESAVQWLYFGIMFAMISYNMLIFIYLRDRSYYYYIIYNSFYVAFIFMSAGFAFHFELVKTHATNMEILTFFGGLAILFAAQFIRVLLDTRKHLPRLDLTARISMAFTGLTLLLIPFAQPLVTKIHYLTVIFNTILGLSAGIMLFQKQTYARDFTLAWGFFFIILLLQSLHVFGINVPLVNMYTLQIGSGLETLLLSFVLARRIRALMEAAEHDSLTGLYNRRSFQKYMEDFIANAKQNDATCALIILDIDDFKEINDVYGHPQGDQTLVELTQIIRETLRSQDFLARWGGEEFVITIRGQTSPRGLEAVADKIRRMIESHQFGIDKKVTCSFGIAQYRSGENLRDFFHRADQVLYLAKKKGKNRIEMAA